MVVQWRQRNVEKGVTHVQMKLLFCLLNLSLLWRSRCRRLILKVRKNGQQKTCNLFYNIAAKRVE